MMMNFTAMIMDILSGEMTGFNEGEKKVSILNTKSQVFLINGK